MLLAERSKAGQDLCIKDSFGKIDRDLLECPADQIRDTQVLSTWLDGETVFEQSL